MSETSVLEKVVSTNGKKAEKPVIDLGYRFKGLMLAQTFIDSGIAELQAAVPFNIEPKKIECSETVEVAGLKLSALKSIPLSLTIVIERLSQISKEAIQDIPDEVDNRFLFNKGLIAGIVTVMLLYYHDPKWSISKVVETFAEHQIDELWDFVEEQRWRYAIKDQESKAEDSEGKQ